MDKTPKQELNQQTTYEQYIQIYKTERDSSILSYYKNSDGEKKRALAYILYSRGYKNFENQ